MKISRLNPFETNIKSFLLLSAMTGTCVAADVTWDTVPDDSAVTGGIGTWDTLTSNWTTDAGVTNTQWDNALIDTAVFTGTGDLVTLDPADLVIGGLKFEGSGYTLAGGTLSLGANATILQTTSLTNTTTISSKISGTSKLILNATSYSWYANLTLSGANDYSGGTDLNHNTIVTIGNATAFGTGTVTVNGFFGQLRASTPLTIANNIVLNNNWGLFGSNNVTTNGTLNLGNATRTIEVASGRTFVIGGNTSNGALTKTGVGVLRLTNSSYTGATTVSNGTLRLRNSSSSSGFSLAAGANLQLTNITLSSSQNITGAGNVSSDISVFGNMTLNGTNNDYTGSTTVNISRTTVGANGVVNGTSKIDVLASWGANFNNQGSVTTVGDITVFGSGDTTVGGVTTDSSFFRNSGTLVAANLNLNSSASTNTTANRGGTFTQTAGSTTLSGKATLAANGGIGAAGTAGNDAAFNLSGGTFSAPEFALNSGTLTATGGILTLGAAGLTSTGENTISINFGSTTLAASAAWNSSVSATLTDIGTGTTVDTSGGDITLSGTLAGSGKLNKASTGTLVLSGPNTYLGATTINGGTLALSGTGTIADSESITIAAGAQLDTTAKTGPFSLDGETIIFGLEAAATGSSGKIDADELAINGASVSFNISGTLDDPEYVLASYTSLTGTFAAAPPVGYEYDYGTGTNSQIKLVQINGYDSWIDSFTFEPGADKSRTGDPDGDSFNNLQEFLFGTAPNAGNGSLSTTEKSGGTLIIRWNQRVSGATYTLKESATLANPWTTSPAPVSNDGAAVGDYQPRRADVTIGSGKLFFRLEAEENN
jgi:autotransporter-associated beta strand protein